MLLPKRTKYRKLQRGTMKGHETRGTNFEFGTVALQTLDPGWITSRQIEAARRAIARCTRRGGEIHIRIFPSKSITQKPAETRMGSGKGSPEYWVAVVKPGRIMFEIEGVDKAVAKEALALAAQKMPVRCRIIAKDEVLGADLV